MGLLDIFKATENKKLKLEVETLQLEKNVLLIEVERLTKLVTPEHIMVSSLEDEIRNMENNIKVKASQIKDANLELDTIKLKIEQNKEKLIQTDEVILLQEFGLYKPMYDFANSYEYKDSLDRLRQKQKDMIKDKSATDAKVWTVDGNAAKGRKMTNDNIKQILRSFTL